MRVINFEGTDYWPCNKVPCPKINGKFGKKIQSQTHKHSILHIKCVTKIVKNIRKHWKVLSSTDLESKALLKKAPSEVFSSEFCKEISE